MVMHPSVELLSQSCSQAVPLPFFPPPLPPRTHPDDGLRLCRLPSTPLSAALAASTADVAAHRHTHRLQV